MTLPIIGTNLSATFTGTTANAAKILSSQHGISIITDPTNDDTDMIRTLDISSNLQTTLDDDNGVLTPLTTSGTYDSVLTEPLVSLAPTDQKIDIIS